MTMLNIGLKNDGAINKNTIRIEKKTTTGEAYQILELYFSYETIVGFRYQGNGECEREISQNDWSKTTGKFLNELEPNKKDRVANDKMIEALELRLSEF